MKITISQYPFSLREPYQAGARLNEAEAKALNGLRAENIRNNMAKVWAKARAGAEAPPSQDELSEFQTLVTDYDLSYRFSERAQPPANASIELEMQAIAREELEEEIRLKGLVLDRFEFESRLEAWLAKPSVLAKAQARLRAKQELALRAMEELLGES